MEWMDFWVILSKNGKKRQIVLKTSTKTKSPDETNCPNIDWIIKAQYASQLTTYFIERKHIQRKGLSPRKHIQMKWLSQLRFLWHLELQVLSSFLHLQAFVLHLDLQVHLNTPCPLFMLWSLAASLTPTSSSGTSSMVSSFWSQKENQFLAKYPEMTVVPSLTLISST